MMDDKDIPLRSTSSQDPLVATLSRPGKLFPQLTETFLGVTGRTRSQTSRLGASLIDKGEKYKADQYEQEVVAFQPPWMQDVYAELVEAFEGSTRTPGSPGFVPSPLVQPSPSSSPSTNPYATAALIQKPPLHQYESAPRLPVAIKAQKNAKLQDYAFQTHPSRSISIDILKGQPFIWQGMGRGRGYYRSYAVALTDAEKKQAREALHKRFKGTLGKGHKRAASLRPLWIPYFTIMVSLIQFIVLIWLLIRNRGFESPSVNPMIGVSVDVLVESGGRWNPFVVRRGEYWRLFTAIFLHSGVVHLGFNLMTQVYVGYKLERNYGPFRIFPIYILSGVFGNVLSAVFLPDLVTVGASGSIFGFSGILIVDLVRHWKALERPILSASTFICGIVLSLILGILPMIDNFAHIGGFLMGILSGLVFLPSNNVIKSGSTYRRRLIEVAVVMTVILALFLAGFILLFQDFPPNWCPACLAIDCVPMGNLKCSPS